MPQDKTIKKDVICSCPPHGQTPNETFCNICHCIRLDKTIKGVMERFDEEFPNSRKVFEGGDPYNSRRNSIKQFIHQEIKLALDSVVPEERNIPHTEPIPELKGHHIGYNQAINEIKENIKHYLK